MNITVIIPVYNANITFLKKTLETIITQDDGCLHRIILVDDGSDEPLWHHEKEIGEISTKIKILRQLNKGPGGARNQGVRHCKTDVIVFLDQDCRPMPGWLLEIIKPILSGQAVAVMGKVSSLPSSKRMAIFADFIGLLRRPSKKSDGTWKVLVTANSAFKRDVLNKLGGFDERLHIAGEDLDLTYRLVTSGYNDQIKYTEYADVRHFHREGLRMFYKQFWGYGYGTLAHCILRRRDPQELGFKPPGSFVVITSFFIFFYKALGFSQMVPWSYGFFNKYLYFPFAEFVRQMARLHGHVSAQRHYPGLLKKLNIPEVRKTVKVIVENENGKFLLLVNSIGGFGLVGGGVEEGETTREALEREFLEELHLPLNRLNNLKCLGDDFTSLRINYVHHASVYYGKLPDETAKDIRLSSEHVSCEWFALTAIPFSMQRFFEQHLPKRFS